MDSWLTARQLGLLASFNERATPLAAHTCIRQIVLSQKGPLLRYTDANIFRGYVLGFLRRALVGNGYQFRAPKEPTVTDQLIDRLLSSLPYPPDDYDKENPLAPWKTTPWVGSRHRMDALYARDFSAGNLNDETLNAIDDLFGPINVDTVAQTMHFVRFCRATNQRGRGEFVTLGNLHARWGAIPTLAIHGADNGLVDVSTQSLLGVNFTAADVPFTFKTHQGLGHQDALIGESSELVFADIEDFLNHPPKSNAGSAIDLQQWFLDVPWIGPRLRLPTVGETSFQSSIACMSSPAFGQATLMLIPVDANLHLVPTVPIVLGNKGSNGTWLFAQPLVDATQALPHGWMAVMAHRASEITLSQQAQIASDTTNPALGATASTQPPGTPPPLRMGRLVIPDPTTYVHIGGRERLTKFEPMRRLPRVSQPSYSGEPSVPATSDQVPTDQPNQEDLNHWLEYMRTHRPADLARCLVLREDWLRATASEPCREEAELTFALGSCQYPAGLLDKSVALASLDMLADDLTHDLNQTRFVIFAGDQIYADATAGLLDPTRRDELYDQPYNAALRMPAMRKVLTRVPAYMLLDDHEIRDNWEPVAAQTYWATARPPTYPQSDPALRNGVAAYMRYQRMHNQHNPSRVIDFKVSNSCAEFYFLDARTQRQLRSSRTLGCAHILSPEQLYDLEAWLTANPDKPKFIVTASLFLPRRLAVAQTASDAAHSDAWDGYSASIAAVLQIIAKGKVKNVVFLSGDEHHSMLAQTELTDTSKPGDPPIKITTVHSSGLYSPLPFANGRPKDFATIDALRLGNLTATSTTRFTPGDGYAQLHLHQTGGSWTLSVNFKKPGIDTTAVHVLLA